MPQTTTVPAVKKKLVELVAAALPGKQVTYSHPGDAQRDEGVYLGDVRGTRGYAAMRAGRKPRQEAYQVDLYCVAIRPGANAEVAEAAAFELSAAVENALAEDPTLGGLLVEAWAGEADFTSNTFIAGNEGWGCEVRLSVAISARLR